MTTGYTGYKECMSICHDNGLYSILRFRRIFVMSKVYWGYKGYTTFVMSAGYTGYMGYMTICLSNGLYGILRCRRIGVMLLTNGHVPLISRITRWHDECFIPLISPINIRHNITYIRLHLNIPYKPLARQMVMYPLYPV
jgi:hypothetical protein